MGIKLPDNAKISMAGLPFHGLWKDGAITLPNDETKTCPAPVNGACVLVKVPDQPAVTRSTEEAAADAAAGREWRNYGLISGGRYGGSAALYADGAATIFYIASTKKRWLVKIEKSSGTTGRFTFKVKRFGHIDGTTEGWSAAVAVTFPDQFWSQIYAFDKLVTISQNSRGSESVIGNSVALLKVTISGDVDLGVAGFGLSITSELIEYRYRLCIDRTIDTTVVGVFTETSVYHYEQRDINTLIPTGTTYDRTVVWTDGTVTEDNGAPPPVSGYLWAPMGQDDAFSSTKVKTEVLTWLGTKYIGAGYHDDAAQLVGNEYEMVLTQTTTWAPNYDIYHWILRTETGDYIENLRAKIGDNTINDQEYIFDQGSADTELGPERITDPLPENMLDGYSNMVIATPLQWEDHNGVQGPLTPWELIEVNGVSYRKSEYLRNLNEATSGFKNPVVALITQTRTIGYGPETDVYTTASVHAPSLAAVATTVNINSLYASWQPVADQLAVDTEVICWF